MTTIWGWWSFAAMIGIFAGAMARAVYPPEPIIVYLPKAIGV